MKKISKRQGSEYERRMFGSIKTPEGWGRAISVIYRTGQKEAIGAVLRIGRYLCEAKAALDHGEWGELFDEEKPLVPMSQRTAERFMAICKNPVLSNSTHVSHLPASWGTLYQLSCVPEDHLLKAIKEGQITPELQRVDARLLDPKNAPSPAIRQKQKELDRLGTGHERLEGGPVVTFVRSKDTEPDPVVRVNVAIEPDDPGPVSAQPAKLPPSHTESASRFNRTNDNIEWASWTWNQKVARSSRAGCAIFFNNLQRFPSFKKPVFARVFAQNVCGAC